MSAGSERKLHVLEGDGGPQPAPSRPERDPRKARPWLLLLLVAVVAVLAIGYAVERGRSAALGARVEGLESELAETRATLQAAEQRMDVVRGHVSDLASRIGLLQEAVEAPLATHARSGEAGGPEDGSEGSREPWDASEAPAPLE